MSRINRRHWIQPREARDSRGAAGRVGAFMAMPLVALLVAACGGGGGGESADNLPGPPDARANGLSASRSGDLVAQVQRVLRERGTTGSNYVGMPGPPVAGGAPGTTAASSGGDAVPLRSDTLTQEVGVDEADLLKTDGRHLYSVSRSASGGLQLAVHRRANDGSITALATLPLSDGDSADVWNQGLLLASDASAGAVITRHWTPMGPPEACNGEVCPAAGLSLLPRWSAPFTDVQRLTLNNGVPGTGDRLRIEGYLVDSRRVGDRLLIVTQHRPVLPLDLVGADATAAQREAAIARTTARDVLPSVRVNGGAEQPLLPETDCWVQPANASKTVEVTTVTVIDLRSASLARTSRCFIGGSEAVYMTPSSLYLATTRWSVVQDSRGAVFAPDMRTDIHKFAFDATTGSLNYRASADVPGHLGWQPERKSWRLSEHEGHLRVLSFTGQTGWMTTADAGAGGPPPSPATLTVLREQAGQGALQTVATLPNSRRPAAIGKPGEQVYGVRFVGNQGYVVTFRRIDPLYVLDLADATDPKIAGELETPGFSDHLIPLGNGLLFGVGQDADPQGRSTGAKVALIDVSDPARPREIASQKLGGPGSTTALDGARAGLNFLTVAGMARVALPVQQGWEPGRGWATGLMRWDVDLAGRRLLERATFASVVDADYEPVHRQRSVQIGEHVYYLRQGQIVAERW